MLAHGCRSFCDVNHPDPPPQITRARRIDAALQSSLARRALTAWPVDDDPNLLLEAGPDVVRHALDIEIPAEKHLRTTPGQPHPPTRRRSSGPIPVLLAQSHHNVNEGRAQEGPKS